MKNILLVEPKSPDFNIYSMFKIPRLGLALLGTAARQAGYNVKIIYQESVPLRVEHIRWADLVGFSITTSTALEGYRLARSVRDLDLQKHRRPIVFGGVHATFKPEEALKEGDYVLRGEADHTFVPFLDALREGGSLAEIPGLSRKDRNKIIHNPGIEKGVNMDSVLSPDWNLFERYKLKIGAVMTSRGCPYDCSFCSVAVMLGRAYRMRSVDKIMEDLGGIKCRGVFFYDDNFAANKKRTKELLGRIIAERGKTHRVKFFSAQVRADVARDPELLDLMKEAGFITLFMGFESVNQNTLDLYNKKQSLEDIKDSIIEIHKRGINIHGMFVLGSDADDEETLLETAQFALRNKIETVQFLILTPLPGTRQYREFEKEGRIFTYDWKRFDAFNVVFLPLLMTPYQLQMGMIKAMKHFYSRWGILRWLLRGKPYVSALNAYGRRTLNLWIRNNRKLLKSMQADNRELFVPESMQAACSRP